MVPGFLPLCLLPPSSPTILSPFVSLYKAHWYAFGPGECCFASKKATKPEKAKPPSSSLTCCTDSPSKKGNYCWRLESANALEVDGRKPRKVQAPWLETTYCCRCFITNPFLWLSFPLGGVPWQQHVPSSLMEVVMALLDKGWGLCLLGAIKTM